MLRHSSALGVTLPCLIGRIGQGEGAAIAGKRPLGREGVEITEALEREVRELRQANEILRKASAYFAMAELDRRSKT